MQVLLTQAAAKRLSELMTQEKAEGMLFRVAVSGGGCSGFQYGFSFDDQVNGDDRIFERDGVRAVIDEISLELLDGAEIDWVEDLGSASFQVRNPNARSSCGCGNSFSL